VTKRDDWPITRTKQSRFTAQEKEFIRERYKDGWPAKAVAKQLGCSSRTIEVYYADFKTEIPVRERGPSKLRQFRS
jgi:hypothetical protein